MIEECKKHKLQSLFHCLIATKIVYRRPSKECEAEASEEQLRSSALAALSSALETGAGPLRVDGGPSLRKHLNGPVDVPYWCLYVS